MYKGSTNQKQVSPWKSPVKTEEIFNHNRNHRIGLCRFKVPAASCGSFFHWLYAGLDPAPFGPFYPVSFSVFCIWKTWKIPSGLIGAAEIGIIFGGLGIWVWQGILRLCRELQLLAVRLPLWIMDFDSRMAEYCMKMERAAGLKSGCLFETAAEMTATLGEKAKESLMPFLMTNSLPAAAFLYV